MLAVSLKFPTKRFHATPWGRQVNEGAVEWPPSPWRFLRALVAVWYHKFPEVPDTEVRELIEKLTSPPYFRLPPASQGHTRHYMPLVSGEKTKVFDTFVALSPDDEVVAIWPDTELTPEQRRLFRQFLTAMSYFGRAESWVCGDLLEDYTLDGDVRPSELGEEPRDGHELVRTLTAASPGEYSGWRVQTRDHHRTRRLQELIEAAKAKGKTTDKMKLSPKDEQSIDSGLPATLFDALHADTSALRKGGWNQPPGSRWINYSRPSNAFTPTVTATLGATEKRELPTVARFALCGPVRPLLTEAVLVGERARRILMGCSKKVQSDGNAAAVFSGKEAGGLRIDGGHQHAHFICEASDPHGRISHVNVVAPMGFDSTDELALGRFCESAIWLTDGYKLQPVLLGIGKSADFGGVNEKAGQSCALATSDSWVSRTPFVLNRHLKIKAKRSHDPASRVSALGAALCGLIRLELSRRPQFARWAEVVEIEPLLERERAGTYLGGHFTTWLKFRRERLSGSGARAGSQGYGFRLKFPKPVSGPIALGYGCHFGLGLFVAD